MSMRFVLVSTLGVFRQETNMTEPHLAAWVYYTDAHKTMWFTDQAHSLVSPKPVQKH